ncbi:LIC_10190 family membrane protein, partial [Allocoleopsis sp.]|uniref:LIC_10190 family membrane protein n=1 Tax=Allocoleopsis sp. TaxID=3088169 RepID=UPI002FD401DB
FGFTSSWFALAAPFNAGIFEARTAALTSGFAFLLASLHFLICLTRIWQERGLFEDWFIVIFSFLCLPTISLYGMPISPSPDLPSIILTGIVVWVYMILNRKNKPEKNTLLDSTILPLILSAGATTIKLSAIPLLLVSSLFYILGRRLSILRIFICCAIIFLLILPMLGFGIITSGCPLYPSSFMCMDLPWSVGAKNAENMSKIILDWARWNGFPPANANSWNWFAHWIKVERAAAFLLICSLLSSLAISKSLNKIRVRSKNYILALGLFGISFMIYRAPSLRFGLGYFCLLPALLMTAYCYISSPFLVTAVTIILGTLIYCLLLGLSKTSLALAGITVIVSLVAWFYSRKNNNKFFLRVPLVLIVVIYLKFFLFHSNNLQYLILPAQLLIPNSAQLLNRQTNDIKYVISTVTSTEGLCWAAELPCTPTPISETIRLRDPERGIAKGFIRN